MNCSQARAMLAAYREIKNKQVDAVALERHLRSCAECKAFFAQGNLVGEQLRALPEIELPADAHTKLMKALAVEHARFIQQSPASKQSIPVPVFLAPYLKEQGQEIPDNIAAFSTADTGPLPIIQMPRKRKSTHRSLKMSPFVVVGLAAAFLMTIMVGGLTSLVILTNRGLPAVRQETVGQTSQLSLINYTTTTSYTHIASAVGSRDTIYYTAYGHTNSEWMLAALDNQTKVSTPLLPQASTSPLLVLSSSNNWLIWLRFDLPQQVVIKNAHTHKVISSYEGRTWSLEATYLGSDPASTFTTATPITLQKGIFDTTTAPSWVQTPIEGIWSGQNMLLVTTLDKQGTSHLIRYTLDAEKSPRATELASTQNGHILTSPTATSNGTSIYWSEEWMDSDNVLHSDIWAQKIGLAPLPLYGKWGHQASTDTYLFLADKASFHPQVVSDMLFLLDVKHATLPDVTTVDAAASGTPTATATSGAQSTTTDRINTPFYTPLPDDTLQGTLQAFSALDDSALQLPINEVVQVPQAGSRFLLWQNSTRGIGMYDAVAKEIVLVGSNPTNNATLLSVNGDTTVWTANPTNNANNQSALGATNAVTFGMFNWPTRAPIAP
ncbi:MAG TPA: hypothetical protein VII61_01805 [Ktedonobacteraceae bacterium]